ncbi:unnamed protein product [Meganyctiphanes norvegica]|uniref:Uncharacterized protein n=1 Tax=Meganyctiphanes norvegica TaxID=48144 RepID=A0AAV2RWN6_MEGNR
MTVPITMDSYSMAFLIICINTAMGMDTQNEPDFDIVSTSYHRFSEHRSHNRSARRAPAVFNDLEELPEQPRASPVKTFNDLEGSSQIITETVICTLPDGTCYQNKACRSQYWGANRELWTECPCGSGYTRKPYYCENYETKCSKRIQDFGCSWILECYLEVDMDEHESYRYEKNGECHVNIGIVIGLVIGLVCILVLILLVILYFIRRKDDYRASHIITKESAQSFLNSQITIPLKYGDEPIPEGPRRKRSYTPPRGSRHGSIKGTPPPIRRQSRHHHSSFSSHTGSLTQTTSLHSPLTPISPLPSCDEVRTPLRAGEVPV